MALLHLLFQRGTEGFWKSVAHYVPREPVDMRILNPYFIQEAAFQFIGLPLNNGLMGKGVSGDQGVCVCGCVCVWVWGAIDFLSLYTIC